MYYSHKAKSLKNNEWVFGTFFSREESDGSLHHYIISAGEPKEDRSIKMEEVSLKSVKTGTDFYDKNGNQIFSGDFVRFYFDPNDESQYDLGLVYFSIADSSFYLLSSLTGNMESMWQIETYEIVGNVLDNREMKKEITLDSDGNVNLQLTERYIKVLDSYQKDLSEPKNFFLFMRDVSEFCALARLTDLYKEGSNVMLDDLTECRSFDECFQLMLQLCENEKVGKDMSVPILILPIIFKKIRNGYPFR